VYLCTVKGIARLTPRAATPDDPSEFAVSTFTIEDGLPSNETTTGSFMLDRRGRVWVGTRGGATVFDPSAEVADRVPKPLRIERAVLAGSGRALGDGMSLRYDENNLTFEYALLSYFHGRDTRYRVHLVGNDDAPSDWTTDTKKDYTNLAAGDYVFKVWGKDYAGNVTGPVSIAFSVSPAPWRTWWALLIYCAAGAAAVAALVRLQVRKARRREQEKALIQEAEFRTAAAELNAKAAEAQAQALEAEHRRKTKELEEARALQLSMLPNRLPDLPHLEIAAYMRTATEVGGDYYDFHTSEDGVLTMAIGDATGHGLKAGTVVTATKGLFCVLAENPDIRETMREITRTLKRMKLGRLYMALTLAKVKGNTVTLSAAGMPAALVYRAATGEVEAVVLKGMPLGAFVDFRYEERALTLGPGDTLALMSDGFPEMFNEEKEMLGYERAVQIFREAAARPAPEVIDHMKESAERWAGTRPPDDDVTFVVLKMQAA
jgi:serine phosphatase RsbU (regulator of sigma subunit)